MNGFDASLLNGLLQNEDFKTYFHGANTGIWVGIVAFLYQIGSIAATPFTGPAVDAWGRRRGIFIGAFVVTIGTVVQGTVVYTHNLKQFMAGRFIVGFGAQIAGSAGPIYVIEMCHPAHRGVITAFFNTFWFTGSIISASAIRGSLKLAGNITWILPVWLQLLCSSLIVASVLFLPESPRWLFVNNQQDRAEAILIRYHGMNNVSSIWVQLQLREYEESLNKNGADKRWWDYRCLFHNRASMYRLICAILMNIFGQWTGNAILGILLSAVLDRAGIRNETMQTNINLGLACLQLVMAVIGAFLVDLVGRRPLLVLTNITLAFIWLGVTVATFSHTNTGSVGAGRAVLALICMFDIVFATGITPLQVLYPVEILSFEMRAKGVALTGLFADAAGLLNQFAWPIALADIGWRTYIILMSWCLFQALVIYLYFPETRNRTLEELDKIFDAKDPRSASLEKEVLTSTSHASSHSSQSSNCSYFRAGTVLALFLCHAVHALPVGWGRTVLTTEPFVPNADGGPIAQSSDIWATVIANVAPLMALVGERNAKEFLRASSSWDQRLIMATAPLGILSIMICAIRLSGPRLLRRLIGRESERRSEALVELTPLSVAPASSVFTSQGLEIEPSEQQHRVAFVCAHIKSTTETFKALSAFKTLLTSRGGKAGIDRDYEIVLGITKSNLSADETAKLVTSIIDDRLDIDESLARGVKRTSLSFRTTGISPTQTASKTYKYIGLPQLGSIFTGLLLFILMCGVQAAGYYYGGSRYGTASLQTLVMGLCGYCGMVIFIFALLMLIKASVSIEPLPLPLIFDESTTIWTFSDARHAEHRAFSVPPQRNLVLAAPAYIEDVDSKLKREILTTLTCAGLVCSFIAYYLAVRVAQWWVPFSNLAIIWLAAAFRAILIKSFLVADEDKEDPREHWLGIFRDNVYDSLVATVETISPKGADLSAAPRVGQPPRAGVDPQLEVEEAGFVSCVLVVAKPIRQSLKSWSGGEDVMKVGLEMAKNICNTHTFAHAGHDLNIKKMPFFKRVLRFRLMIYVPGVLWKADTDLDYVMTDEFDLPNLYRDMMKIIHLCANVRGNVTRRTLTLQSQAEISNVLCGPVRVPSDNDLGGSKTLRELLHFLRSLNPPSMKYYTLEQTLLLPTIQLATMCESFHQTPSPRIATYQNGYTDNLRLSGAAYLGSLERAFEQHGIWDAFMVVKPAQAVEDEGVVRPRDEASGLYGRPVGQRQGMTQSSPGAWLQSGAWLQDRVPYHM